MERKINFQKKKSDFLKMVFSHTQIKRYNLHHHSLKTLVVFLPCGYPPFRVQSTFSFAVKIVRITFKAYSVGWRFLSIILYSILILRRCTYFVLKITGKFLL